MTRLPKSRTGTNGRQLAIQSIFDLFFELGKVVIDVLDVELRKNQLALKGDSNMHDFYNIFDVENKGYFDFV